MTLAPAPLLKVLPHGCAYLFFALLLLLVSLPLLIGSNAGRIVANLINLVVLLTAVVAVGRTWRLYAIAVLLGLPVLGFQVAGVLWAETVYLVLSWAFGACFYFWTIALLLRYVLQPEVMNANKLYGAGAIYLMLGVTWAYFYGVVQFFYPGSFSPAGAPLHQFDLLYFSFAVLTTAGFGDIVPVHPVARGLTMLEQIIGVLYVAILIARLSGMYSEAESGGAK
jgi:hypothetical protein